MNPRLTRLLAALGGLGLAGCVTVGEDYKPPATDVPATWRQLNAPDATVTAGAVADLSQWWRSFNDPFLIELVDEALRASPDLKTARARLRSARARRVVAASDHYPSVDAAARASRSRSSEDAGSGDTVSFYRAGFDASWEFDVFGGVRRNVEAAEADLESSVADLYETRVSLAAEVASNYVDARALQIRVDIARANLATQTETLQLTDWRAQAGLVSTQDAEQARSNREQTRAQIPALETRLAETTHALDLLLGLPPGTLGARFAAPAALPAVADAIAVGIPADALRRRPDLRAAERALAAETARVGAAQAARYPAFALSGSIGVEALTLGALGHGGAASSSLLGGIAAPIFNAGRLRAQVEIQDAVREQAEIAYRNAVRVALQDVENALVALVRNGERVDALSLAAEAARNAARLARERYSAGLVDFQSVLDTERSVLSIEDGLASARADRVLALIRLYKALGGGWSPSAAAASSGEDTP